jgi:hypothetical protein
MTRGATHQRLSLSSHTNLGVGLGVVDVVVVDDETVFSLDEVWIVEEAMSEVVSFGLSETVMLPVVGVEVAVDRVVGLPSVLEGLPSPVIEENVIEPKISGGVYVPYFDPGAL